MVADLLEHPIGMAVSKPAKGGFDYEFVDIPSKSLECPVCLLTLREPHVISCCGYHFCRPCIDRIRRDGKPCPLCNDPSFSIMLHKGVMREINSLKVRCPHSEKGCQWVDELGHLQQHVSGVGSKDGGCGYVEVECAYKCGLTFQRRLIREHELDACPKRPVEVQMSSVVRKLELAWAENHSLKEELTDLREKFGDQIAKLSKKVDATIAENKALKEQIVMLECKPLPQPRAAITRVEFESLKREITNVAQTEITHSTAANVDRRAIREELQELKQAHQQHKEVAVEERQALKQELSHLRLSHLTIAKEISHQQEALVSALKEKNVVQSPRVEAVLKLVDRKNFAPNNSYQDSPQSIGCGTSISAPHMHGHTLEQLKDHLFEGATVLDVGSGSGYLTACMAHLIGVSGYVVGVDHIQELNERAMKSVMKNSPELFLTESILFVTKDGYSGYAEKSPYNVIHVGGATPTVPQALYDQLKPGGRMIIPVGPPGGTQYLELHDKSENGKITKKRLMGVRYASLTTKEKQLRLQ